jgi:hypothetical protein
MFYQVTHLLTAREATQVLRQSEWSVRQKVGRGEIPSLRVGVGPRAPIRIVRADLERWVVRASSEATRRGGEVTLVAPPHQNGRL